MALESTRLQLRPNIVDIYREIDRGYGDASIEEAIRAQGALGRLREALGIFTAPSTLKEPGARGGAAGMSPNVRAGGERSSYDFTMPEIPLSRRADIHNAQLERTSGRGRPAGPPA
jgi:hypothetical protein